MQLAFVTHAYPRWDGDVAGTFIERLAIALKHRGHTITILAPADHGRGGPERRKGIDIMWLRYAPKERETLAYRGTMVEEAATVSGKLAAVTMIAALARPIRRMARRGVIDVVHAHWWLPGGTAAWMALRSSSRPYVVTVHGTDLRMLAHSGMVRCVGRRVLRRAAAVTTVSSYLADGVSVATGLPRPTIRVQPMPADLIRFARPSRGGGGVVTVGRLVAQKRIDVIIEAAAKLHQRGRQVPLTIIGDGPLRDALEEHALRLGVGGMTRFLGEVEPARLSEAIGDADVFAFTAQAEGLGLAAAEALLLGIPVVATDAGGGVRDIVPDTGAGRIVPDGDPAAFASAIGDLLDDPSSRERAVEVGGILRERFDPARVAEAYEALYVEACQGARKNRA